MDKLTSEDIRLFKYYFEYKGDIAKWCDWEKKEYLFRKELPHIMKAYDDFNNAETILNIVVNQLDEYDYED